MVYLSKNRIKGKTYFYLVRSLRIGSSYKKIMKLLKRGEEKLPISRLEERYIGYFLKKEQEINVKASTKKFNESYIFSADEIKKIEEMKVSYKYLLRKLSKQQLKDIFDRFTVNFTYDSNAIEGNSLTLKDVAIIIEKGVSKGGDLREVYETKNSREVVDLILKRKFSVTEKDIIRMHKILMKNMDERTGYKQFPNIIYKTERAVETVPPEKVSIEMKKLIGWYNQNLAKLHPLELASIFHGKFEKIHPFEDGNGRVGRFLMNIILINNGYPPIIIRKTSRIMYMNALSAFDAGYEDKLKRFVLDKFKDTFKKFFEIYIKYI